MAKQIILLEKAENSDRGFRVVLWAITPVARRPYWAFIAPAASAYKLASAQENTDIVNGVVAESLLTIIGDLDSTVPQFQTRAEVAWADWNARVQAFNPWRRYGTTWDGSTWAPAGPA